MPLVTYVRGTQMRKALRQPYKQFFGTLANQIRIDIIELLVKSGDRNVSKIVSSLSYDQTSISHSLSRLEECGFVTVRKKGKERIYSINHKTIEPLLTLMQVHMDNYCKHVVAKSSRKIKGRK